MRDDVDALAAGIADRLWTRLAAQDRLEALDEHASGPTLVDRLAADPELLAARVDEGLDEVLAALASAARRDRLRDLRDGVAAAAVDDELLRAGLVQASWTGDTIGPSSAGEAASRLLDGLAAQVAAALRERLARSRAG